MMRIIKKVIRTLYAEIKTRGLYHTSIMYFSYLLSFFRAFFYKIIFLKNISSSIFMMQSNSKIQIFNKKAKMLIGPFVFIRKNASFRIDFNGELVLGEKVFINDNCNINCVKRVVIGKQTKIGPNVSINDHDHNYKKLEDQHLLTGDVIIGENVWIGSNVVILRNTTIGDNAVIAAGSIVKGFVPANSLFVHKRENEFKQFTYKDTNEMETMRDIN